MPQEGGGAGSQVSPFSAVKRAEGAATPQGVALKWEIKGGGRARFPPETPTDRAGGPGRRNRCQAGVLGDRMETQDRPRRRNGAGRDAVP